MKEEKVKLVATYDRVSTIDQAYNGDGTVRTDASPEAQRHRCLSHMKFMSQKTGQRWVLYKHISDLAYSGKNTNRPGYQELWDLIGSSKIHAVMATDLSRLSRSVIDFLHLVSHCEHHKVDLVIIGLDLDTSNPFGRVIVIILVALGQFEREMTAVRVRENALARLLKDGKINGAAEILGLDRDPEKKGHFLINHEEMVKVEKILHLFIRLSSKKKVLAVANELGLTGKNGREFTAHMLDIMLENVKWRYRGLWYANGDNRDLDQDLLPESKRYQVIKLPHGPLIRDKVLLDSVEEKLTATFKHKMRAGKDNYVYLLSHLLYQEDGSRFYGQPGNGRNKCYRYYYNDKHKLRVHCEELDKVVVNKIKATILDDSQFREMVKDATKRRQANLPALEEKIRDQEKVVADLEGASLHLREQLLDQQKRGQTGFMEWLEGEVKELSRRREQANTELELLRQSKATLVESAGLSDLRKLSMDFLKKFDGLTGTERRSIMSKLVQRIILRSNNQLEIQFFGQPRLSTQPVAERKKGLDRVNVPTHSLHFVPDT